MYKVNDEQIDFILSDIAKRGIETEDVRFNILDHVCCIIENEMPNDSDFIEFYERTISRFYKKKLRELQEETNNLIIFKYYYAMRRTLKISGAASMILSILGAIFKAQHLPGANILILLSLFFFAFIFIPLNIVMKFKNKEEGTNRFVMSFGFIVGIIITTGFIFKLFYWPASNIIMLGGLSLFSFIFIPIYFITSYRSETTRFNGIINTTFMVAGAGLVFALVSMKTSANVTSSIHSMESFQSEKVRHLKVKNTELYKTVEQLDIKEAEAIRIATKRLDDIILAISANLISHSNSVPFEKAKSIKFRDVIGLNNSTIIQREFDNSKGKFSHNELINAANSYNETIKLIQPKGVLQPIDINKTQMSNTILSVVLIELTNIRANIYYNEYSYLCYQQGLLAQKT
ncbi:MAG: hypothetical protein MK066_11945 [Crocinitomicaceae bacterium]|nr:hypothetical protein [Crocinitomicaceae bacterium]